MPTARRTGRRLLGAAASAAERATMILERMAEIATAPALPDRVQRYEAGL